MIKKVTNLAIIHPIRAIERLPPRERAYLLKQMSNYLFNCEYEEKKLHTLKDKVNS